MKTNQTLKTRNRKFSLKKALAIIGGLSASHLLAIILTVTIVTASFTVYNLYFDALPHTATYTIEADGSGSYRAIKYDGSSNFESTNASYVLTQAITNGEKVFLKAGTYPLSVVVQFTIEANAEKQIIGEGIATVITSSQSKVIDVLNSVWGSGEVYGLDIENMKIEHTTPSSSAVTLDLSYSHAMLKNLWLTQKNATKQGTGIKTGPIASAGKTVSFRDITVSNYGVGYDIAMDHLYVINAVANNIADKGFYFHDCEWSHLMHPQVYVAGAEKATVYPYYLSHLGFDVTIQQPSVEIGSGTLTNPMFYFTGTTWIPTMVYDPHIDTSGNTLSNDFTNIKFFGRVGKFKIQNSGTTTIANNEWVPHGLATTPTVVTVTTRTATYDGVAVTVGWIGQNSTHFQVSAYWTNSTAITADAINISWYAEA